MSRVGYSDKEKAIVVLYLDQFLKSKESNRYYDPVMEGFELTIAHFKDQHPVLRWHSLARWWMSGTLDTRSGIYKELKNIRKTNG